MQGKGNAQKVEGDLYVAKRMRFSEVLKSAKSLSGNEAGEGGGKQEE